MHTDEIAESYREQLSHNCLERRLHVLRNISWWCWRLCLARQSDDMNSKSRIEIDMYVQAVDIFGMPELLEGGKPEGGGRQY